MTEALSRYNLLQMADIDEHCLVGAGSIILGNTPVCDSSDNILRSVSFVWIFLSISWTTNGSYDVHVAYIKVYSGCHVDDVPPSLVCDRHNQVYRSANNVASHNNHPCELPHIVLEEVYHPTVVSDILV